MAEKPNYMLDIYERRDTKIVASFSQDGGKTWKAVEEKTLALPRRLKVRVAAVNSTNGPFTVTLEDFKISKRVNHGPCCSAETPAP